jgi:hypothetical protein
LFILYLVTFFIFLPFLTLLFLFIYTEVRYLFFSFVIFYININVFCYIFSLFFSRLRLLDLFLGVVKYLQGNGVVFRVLQVLF